MLYTCNLRNIVHQLHFNKERWSHSVIHENNFIRGKLKN